MYVGIYIYVLYIYMYYIYIFTGWWFLATRTPWIIL